MRTLSKAVEQARGCVAMNIGLVDIMRFNASEIGNNLYECGQMEDFLKALIGEWFLKDSVSVRRWLFYDDHFRSRR